MPKPYQISIRRMLCAMACFSVGMGSFFTLFSHIYDHPSPLNDCLLFCLFPLGLVSMGAGIGAITGSAVRGALFGFGCFVLLFVLSSFFLPAVQT